MQASTFLLTSPISITTMTRAVYFICWSFLHWFRLLLPVSSSPSPNMTSLLTSNRPVTQCDTFLYAPVLNVTDCLKAISRLPSDAKGDVIHDPDHHKPFFPIFSYSALESRHHLPKQQSFGTCMAFVKLHKDTPFDQGTWRSIKARALAIVRDCVAKEGLGGKADAGLFQGLEVHLLSLVKPEHEGGLLRTMAKSDS